jgi:SulP family sulfate permease
MLQRGGQLDRIGPENVFVAKDEAIGKVFTRLDKAICRQCTARIFLECQTVPERLDDRAVARDRASPADLSSPRGG